MLLVALWIFVTAVLMSRLRAFGTMIRLYLITATLLLSLILSLTTLFAAPLQSAMARRLLLRKPSKLLPLMELVAIRPLQPVCFIRFIRTLDMWMLKIRISKLFVQCTNGRWNTIYDIL